MEPVNPPEDLRLGYELITLCKESGSRSGWIQIGGQLIESNLTFAQTRVAQMVEVVDKLVSSYAEVGRPLEAMFFGFSKQCLLVVCEGDRRLALLFAEGPKPLNEIIGKVRAFLREKRALITSLVGAQNVDALSPAEVPRTAETPSGRWEVIEPKIKGVLCRVMNSAQAQRLIDRTLAERSMPGGPPDAMIADVVRQMISKIPHRGKQAAILAELNDELENAGLS